MFVRNKSFWSCLCVLLLGAGCWILHSHMAATEIEANASEETTSAVRRSQLPSQVGLNFLFDSTNNVRVLECGQRNGISLQEKVLLESSELSVLESLKSCLQITDVPAGRDMCDGSMSIELYKDRKLVASLGIHHCRFLRCNHWNQDAQLKNGSSLVDWMSKHGIHALESEFAETKSQKLELARAQMDWLRSMPKCLSSHISELFSGGTLNFKAAAELNATLSEKYSSDEKILALLKWYGSSRGPWTGYPSYEDLPEQILAQSKLADFKHAIESRPLDSSELEGTARFLSVRDNFKFRGNPSRNLEFNLIDLCFDIAG